jgi:hypothetical protein
MIHPPLEGAREGEERRKEERAPLHPPCLFPVVCNANIHMTANIFKIIVLYT